MAKESLLEFSHRKLRELRAKNPEARRTGNEIDALVEVWANEYYGTTNQVYLTDAVRAERGF